MSARDLVSAWGLLVALSAATALVTISTVTGPQRAIASAGVLILAGLKARIILTRYLGLARSPFWRHVFDAIIGGFLGLAYVIYALSAKG